MTASIDVDVNVRIKLDVVKDWLLTADDKENSASPRHPRNSTIVGLGFSKTPQN